MALSATTPPLTGERSDVIGATPPRSQDVICRGRRDLNVLTEVQGERASKGVDEEMKELIFVNFAVCLLVRGRTVSKQ